MSGNNATPTGDSMPHRLLPALANSWPTGPATIVTSLMAAAPAAGAGEVLVSAGTVGLFLNAAIVGLKLYFDSKRTDERAKLDRLSDKYETLTNSYAGLTEENRELRVEIKDLKAIIYGRFRERDAERDNPTPEPIDGGQ